MSYSLQAGARASFSHRRPLAFAGDTKKVCRGGRERNGSTETLLGCLDAERRASGLARRASWRLPRPTAPLSTRCIASQCISARTCWRGPIGPPHSKQQPRAGDSARHDMQNMRNSAPPGVACIAPFLCQAGARASLSHRRPLAFAGDNVIIREPGDSAMPTMAASRGRPWVRARRAPR